MARNHAATYILSGIFLSLVRELRISTDLPFQLQRATARGATSINMTTCKRLNKLFTEFYLRLFLQIPISYNRHRAYFTRVGTQLKLMRQATSPFQIHVP